MLIHLPPNCSKSKFYEKLIDDFRRAEKRAFYSLMENNPSVEERCKFDEINAQDAHYFFSVYKGRVMSVVRLISSQKLNLVYDLLSPYFAPLPIKRDESLLEMNIFFLGNPLPLTSSILTLKFINLFIGVVKYGLRRGYKKIITAVSVIMEENFKLAGWPFTRLTDVNPLGDIPTVIGTLPISEDILSILKSTKKSYGVSYGN